MIKLVAFDWNGTILSDTNAVIRAESVVLNHFGFPSTTLKEYQKKFRIPIRDYWIDMGIDPELFDKHSQQIEDLFLNAYEPEETKCRTRSGAREILAWLKDNKIKQIIFSNHIVPHIEKQLKRLDILNYFDSIIARPLNDKSHHHIRSKETKLHEYVKNHNINPESVMTVGDTDEEIEIGKAFGYITTALTGGYQSTDRLRKLKPDYLIHNLLELKNIIENYNGRTPQRN